jgi:hypothetical protein
MKTAALSIVLSIVLATAAAAAIPFERAITLPVYGPAPGGRTVAAAANDGNQSLLVWNDSGRGAIYAARVDAAGHLLDDTGIRIYDSGPAYGLGPWVFRGGSAYVVFWAKAEGLQSAQIDSAGKVVAEAHTAFVTNIAVSAMAGSGARIVGVYNGDRLAVFDRDGNLLEKDVALPSPPGSTVTLTSNGNGFLATFLTNAGALYAMPLDAFGHPAGAVHLIAQNITFLTPARASNGNEYLVVVRTITGSSSLRIASSGAFVDRHDLPGAAAAQHALAWTGSEYVYTWSDDAGGTISALRLDPSGAASYGGPVLLANSAGGQTIIAAGSRLLLAWMVWTSPLFTIRAETVTPVTLAHAAPAIVSISAAEQREPRIAWSGSDYLMIWLEGTTLYAARLDADGRSRDPHGIVVANFARNANVVFDGENFVVAWQQTTNNNLWLNRIGANGALLDGDGVPAVNFACTYDVAPGRFATMIAFGDCGGHLQAMRFNRALQPLDVPLTITPQGMTATNPSVAWSGTQWLVAFEEVIALPVFFEVPPDLASRGNVRAARISPSMTLLDTEPLVIATSDADLVSHRAPHAASAGGDDFLITWTRGFFAGPREVHARKLGASSPTYVAAGVAASAVWTGTSYAISFITPTSDALGVTFRDTVLSFFKVAVTVDAEPSLALVSANGRLSGAYARVATEPLYGGVSRVFIRDARPLHGRAAGH